MVLVSYKPINTIVLTGPIVMVMHFLQAGRKRETLLAQFIAVCRTPILPIHAAGSVSIELISLVNTLKFLQ